MGVDKSSARIRQMFGEIARRYDFLNHFLSAGIDRRWRRRTVAEVPPGAGPVLDVCTGTADLALEYWRASGGRVKVVGADFCRPMLKIAGEKCRQAGAGDALLLVESDALQLPFAAATFQVVCVAFGLRNVSDTDGGLAEMSRVCRPGGRVAVLEFSMPKSWLLRTIYKGYFRWILPRVGQAIAHNRQGAYNYLPESVREFPDATAMLRRMEAARLGQVKFRRFTWGVATLYTGVRT